MKLNRTGDLAARIALERAGSEDTAQNADADDRRTYARTKLSLAGRYMLADGNEYACETIDVSPSGVLLKVEMVAGPGARVIAYIEGLGRIEGVVVRTMADGFALALYSAPRKAERLAQMIEWLALNKEEERRNGPRDDRDGAFVLLVTANAREHPVELIDVSTSGVAFLTDLALAIGDPVELGAQRAEVARLFPGGAAVAFL